MPYIDKAMRDILGRKENQYPQNAGELNYCITCLVQAYVVHKGEKYQTYNDAIGALEGAKLELYRRFIGPYEDKKIAENGDVDKIHDIN